MTHAIRLPRQTRKARSNLIDAHVGQRVRLRRSLLGLSQEELGQQLGLSFQQVQKYERGANRVGASRLFDLANALDVPVGYFFDDLPPELQDGNAPSLHRPAGDSEVDGSVMIKPETQDLARMYHRIREPTVRKRFYELVRELAKSATTSPKIR